MKIIILGNAGAGKTTLAKSLIGNQNIPLLCLDDIAWGEFAIRKPLDETIKELKNFIFTHQSWVIEGCYSYIIEAVLDECTQFIFLNPGIEACIAHCHSRGWESEKFESQQAQDDNLANLIKWIEEYNTRTDEYGLIKHQQLFNSFGGTKIEYRNSTCYNKLNENLD